MYFVSTIIQISDIMDFGGFDSNTILILRGGIFMSIGDSPESLSQHILVGIILLGRLGVGIGAMKNPGSRNSRACLCPGGISPRPLQARIGSGRSPELPDCHLVNRACYMCAHADGMAWRRVEVWRTFGGYGQSPYPGGFNTYIYIYICIYIYIYIHI